MCKYIKIKNPTGPGILTIQPGSAIIIIYINNLFYINTKVYIMSSAYHSFREGKKLSKRGKFLEAIMPLEKAKSSEPEKGSIREALASAYYNCGFYPSAKKNFVRALEIDAANDFAHYGLGLCLVKEKKITKAVGHFKIAFFMKPNSKEYKEILGRFT